MKLLTRRKPVPAPSEWAPPSGETHILRVPPAAAEFLQQREAFEDGQAYQMGAEVDADDDARLIAETFLDDDRVHGARRAMLVLAGYVGVDVLAVTS